MIYFYNNKNVQYNNKRKDKEIYIEYKWIWKRNNNKLRVRRQSSNLAQITKQISIKLM